MHHHPEHILFDVDGVLIHTPMWSTEFIRRNNLPPDAMKGFFTGIFRECTLGKANLREVLPPILHEWGYSRGVDGFLQEWFDYENHPDMELIREIQKLRNTGVKCSVATNQEKYRLEYLRNEMRFDAYFDEIFCSAEIGLQKPQKEYYQHILDSLGVDGSEVIYFDDSLENIESARSLGIDARLYRDVSDFHTL